MKPSEILREAARMVEIGSEKFSCRAVATAVGMWDKKQELFPCSVERAAMETDAGRAYCHLLGRKPAIDDFVDYGGVNTQPDEERDHRIVALCLAAAIAESEGQ